MQKSQFIARCPLWSSMPKGRPYVSYFSKMDKFAKLSIYNVLEADFGRDCVFTNGNVAEGGLEKPMLMAFPLVVTEGSSNVFGTMHGGMTATLVDIVTSCHLAEYLYPSPLAHVTSTLSTQYVAAAKKGAPLVAISQISKAGKRLASVSLQIIEEPSSAEMDAFQAHVGSSVFCEDQRQLRQFLDSRVKVIATGSHTKAILPIDLSARMK